MTSKLRRALGLGAAAVALAGSLAAAPITVGAETPAASEPVTASARTATENSRIVRAIYLGFLDREPSPTELTTGAALAANDNFMAIVRTVSRGDEWLSVFVNDLYDQALERVPDTPGLNYWVGLMADGQPSTLIAANVLGSEEFRNKSGNTDEGFIGRLYERVLNRGDDAAGKAYWLGLLSGPNPPSDAQVGITFFESPENRLRRVALQYQQLLCRAPDSAGHAYWAEVIAGGQDIALSEFLATSAEFVNNAVAGGCLLAGTDDQDPDDPGTPGDFTCANVPAGGPVTVANCDGLVALYNATGGANWTNKTGWLSDPNPCTWHGITCETSPSARVAAIDLPNNGLTGAIPANISLLTQTSRLRLGENAITGLPDAMSGMVALEILELQVNAITDLPDIFRAMNGLRNVNVSRNNFASGDLGDLPGHPAIEELWVVNAGLTSLDVTGMTSLNELQIGNDPAASLKNNFTALPTGIGGLAGLETFGAQFNAITNIDALTASAKPALVNLRLNNNVIGTVNATFSAANLPALAIKNANGSGLHFGPQCVDTVFDPAAETFALTRDPDATTEAVC